MQVATSISMVVECVKLRVYRCTHAQCSTTGTSFGVPQFAMAGLGQYDNKADVIAFNRVQGRWTTNICRPEG